jgi:hypothetical protein
MYDRDNVEEEVYDNMVLLEVKKPEFHRCPEPQTIIVEWLEPGWDRFTNTPILKKTLVDSDKVLTYDEETLRDIEYFEDSNDRIQAFEKWIALRINGQINNGLLMKHVAFLCAFTRHILTLSVNQKLLSL